MMHDLFSQAAGHDTDETYDPFAEDEVVAFQPPTAVFISKAGGVTIMQDQTGWMGDHDVMVVLSTKESVHAVIKALQQKLGELE